MKIGSGGSDWTHWAWLGSTALTRCWVRDRLEKLQGTGVEQRSTGVCGYGVTTVWRATTSRDGSVWRIESPASVMALGGACCAGDEHTGVGRCGVGVEKRR
ncbi:hypothetical protein M0R45_008720 [Rubus argutus]|uniref:Uncharacterized protein n=1 Tax=Rubus argutus TaxID=59490 RepID=A0AAW1Y300_RUBAR